MLPANLDTATLLAFIFSYFLIALSPGLCMTLSMTLGISIGVQRALWMMAGELAGVVLVGIASFAGVSTLMLNSPEFFTAAKYAAAAYLLWIAWRAWHAVTHANREHGKSSFTERQLITQGFITATSNPKGWIFLAALLPPFIDPTRAIIPQALIMLGIMVILEFICLLMYAHGGRALQGILTKRGLGHWLNRISACLMMGIATWLVLF